MAAVPAATKAATTKWQQSQQQQNSDHKMAAVSATRAAVIKA